MTYTQAVLIQIDISIITLEKYTHTWIMDKHLISDEVFNWSTEDSFVFKLTFSLREQ